MVNSVEPSIFDQLPDFKRLLDLLREAETNPEINSKARKKIPFFFELIERFKTSFGDLSAVEQEALMPILARCFDPSHCAPGLGFGSPRYAEQNFDDARESLRGVSSDSEIVEDLRFLILTLNDILIFLVGLRVMGERYKRFGMSTKCQ